MDVSDDVGIHRKVLSHFRASNPFVWLSVIGQTNSLSYVSCRDKMDTCKAAAIYTLAHPAYMADLSGIAI